MLYIEGILYSDNYHKISRSYITVDIDIDSIFPKNHEYKLMLIIYYFGIRDYSFLFPHIKKKNPELAKRIGYFYEEAEKSFDSGAWLSYSLMCAAIFEGILFSKHNIKSGFNDLIEDAFKNGSIDLSTRETMHIARNNRNLVHSNKYNDKLVQRIDAMDMRTTMDRLIKDFPY